jgi:hypothetical protein
MAKILLFPAMSIVILYLMDQLNIPALTARASICQRSDPAPRGNPPSELLEELSFPPPQIKMKPQAGRPLSK